MHRHSIRVKEATSLLRNRSFFRLWAAQFSTITVVYGLGLAGAVLVEEETHSSAQTGLVILSSILLPVVEALGVDPVHFGVIICYNLILGIITPPMGIGLFVAARVANITPEAVLKASWPFFIPLLAALVLISAVPALSLWLPTTVYRWFGLS